MTINACLWEKLYLSFVLDLYNSELITFSLTMHPNFSLTTEMLEKLFDQLPPEAQVILRSTSGMAPPAEMESDYTAPQERSGRACPERAIAWTSR